MRLIFGMACDGPIYPDFPGDGGGVFGCDVVGPQGLIAALEIQLGLTGPIRSHAARIAQYVAKMRLALEVQPDLFFASSSRVDPWATAATLLGWRDDLVGAGWDECVVGCERVDALASLAEFGDPLSVGLEDRLTTLRQALSSCPQLAISSVEVIEPLDTLPTGWRNLVEALAGCGVEVKELSGAFPCASGDLGRIQHFLATGTTGSLDGDGSVIFVESDTAIMAAEAVAEWLAHGSEEELGETVVISADGNTALLDLALQSRGLPALGQSVPSPWRGALQVLPLAIAAAWAPFDAEALLNLLLLPSPPVPRHVAHRLANALSREPGRGGAQWRSAWEKIEADVAQEVSRGELDSGKADRCLAGWRKWTTGGLHLRNGGMPAQSAREIAGRVRSWALEIDAGSGDPLLLAAVGAADGFIEAIDLLGLDTIPALLVERMLEQVAADGAKDPGHIPTAGGLRCVRHPGAIWSTASRVLWWNFNGPGERIPSSPWSTSEMAALSAAGCQLESPADRARRIGGSYASAVLRADGQLMFVSPAFSGREQASSHPLEHQLQPLVSKNRSCVTWRAERLFQEAEHRLLGRDLCREPIEIVQAPCQRTTWIIPESIRGRLAARVESATSLERLVDCQMRWLLTDVLHLSRGRIAEIPNVNRLLGNLAHELANAMLLPGEPPEPARMLANVGAAFEEMVSAIATPLQRPEHASELAAARVRIPQALARLAGILREKGLTVVATEMQRDRDFANGLTIAGRLDLIVRHPTKGLGVIDLKWSRSVTRRCDELSKGRALQLATYGELADPEGSTRAEGAFYLLAQRRMIGLAGGFLADETVPGDRSLPETWTALVDTWRVWRDLALAGTLIASGTSDAEDHVPTDLAIAPGSEPCRYCELTSLCRVQEGEI